MDTPYSISVVPCDLRSEETIYQILDRFDKLNIIVEDIFSKINNRIDHNTSRIQNVKERVKLCSDKVDKLTTVSKAIQVFSSPKYPAGEIFKHYESMFEPFDVGCKNKADRVKRNDVVFKKKPSDAYTEKSLQEKLHFYHVRAGKNVQLAEDPAKANERDLRAAADEIETVGSLLVYDTHETPYAAYGRVTTTFKSRSSVGAREDVPDGGVLEAAPMSLVNRDYGGRRDVDQYLYTPGMGEVPDLDMPLDLPHLPGIAGDLQFVLDVGNNIAPSAVVSPVSADILPDIVESIEEKVEQVVETPPAPLPPPPPQQIPAPPAPPAVHQAPPPPPPPPPPPVDVSVDRVPTASKNTKAAPSSESKAAKVSTTGGDSHSNLMEAIRKAGGAEKAKLRAASDVKTVDNKKSAPPKPAAGGDLMADLHAKLSMRRKGIAGARPETILDVIATAIPEPENNSSAAETSDHDEDWD